MNHVLTMNILWLNTQTCVENHWAIVNLIHKNGLVNPPTNVDIVCCLVQFSIYLALKSPNFDRNTQVLFPFYILNMFIFHRKLWVYRRVDPCPARLRRNHFGFGSSRHARPRGEIHHPTGLREPEHSGNQLGWVVIPDVGGSLNINEIFSTNMFIHLWLVVEPPLWKIWKSNGMLIPNIWEK